LSRFAAASAKAAGHGFDADIEARRLLPKELVEGDALGRNRSVGLQATRQQEVLDQCIQLGDIALRLGAQVLARAARQQLQGHPKSSEGSPQLVGRARQHATACGVRALDPLRRPIEAPRQGCHLVAPLDGNSHAQIALAELLHAALQPLQSTDDAPRDRIGAQGDCPSQQREGDERPGTSRPAMPRVDPQPAPVSQLDGDTGNPGHPPSAALEGRPPPSVRSRRPGGGDALALVAPQTRPYAETVGLATQLLGEVDALARVALQSRGDLRGTPLEEPRRAIPAQEGVPADHGDPDAHEQGGAHDASVDLEEEPAPHDSPSGERVSR
jgi:hypothetical protein